MSSPNRKLAERIVVRWHEMTWPADPRPKFEGLDPVDEIEAILDERFAGLRVELMKWWNAPGHTALGMQSVSQFADRVLGEGGEQADGSAPQGTEKTVPAPAAPDQPHEFLRSKVDRMRCGFTTIDGDSTEICNHPADAPIHEVNDDREPQRRDGCGSVGEGRLGGREGGDGEHEDAGVGDAVTVGPGDEVYWPERGTFVVRALSVFSNEVIIESEVDGELNRVDTTDLRTPDGKRVSGFEDRPTTVPQIVDALRTRIAELERELAHETKLMEDETVARLAAEHERDEARAERDELAKVRAKPPYGWVRLDDETIERVITRYDECVESAVGYVTDEDLSRTRTIEAVLRDLRDGKLGGGQ